MMVVIMLMLSKYLLVMTRICIPTSNLTDGLTDDDITDYFYDNIHVSINNKEAKGIEDSANYNDEQLNKMV